MIRVLVCGGRDYSDWEFLFATLDRLHRKRVIACVIHGACPVRRGGADMLADEWARTRGVAVEAYPIDHTVDGPWPGAGPNRNQRMLDSSRPDGVVAYPGGGGTADMKRRAIDAGLKVWEPVYG